MELLLYILAISFQLAGALLILFFSTSTKRDDIIRRFIVKGFIIKQGDTIDYDKSALLEEYKSAYLSRLAFLYISVGYILGIWGEISNYSNKFIVFLLIIISTAVIMAISYFGISKFVKKRKKVNVDITISELEKQNIHPTLEYATNSDMDQLFENNNDSQGGNS